MIPFDDDEEALSIANDRLYGLAGGTWTSDMIGEETQDPFSRR